MKLHGIRAKVDLLLLLGTLPLIGLLITRKFAAEYLEFPPLTRYVEHAGFSWAVFIGLAALVLIVVMPFVVRVFRCQTRIPRSTLRTPRSAFPWWGWCGVGLLGVTWLMAWTRFSWFASLQLFTFAPIWLGYILVVNGLTWKRTGHCLLRDRPGFLAALFIISACFWWYFEYLNRFVQNWYYVGVGDLSRIEYFLFATLPFATVLPAVLSTRELLASVPRLSAGLDDFIKIRIPHPRLLGWISLTVFSTSLAAISIWPDYLFPLLWVAPLFIITSWQAINGEKSIFSETAAGNWRHIYLLAVSALICGFFWELWNYHSVAKWIYAVPFVNKFKIFEMPILGYAGYLPFGLECAVIAEVIMKTRDSDTVEIDRVGLTRPGYATLCKYGNGVVLSILALYFFLIPGLLVIRNLSDPNIRGEGIPGIAWRLHRELTPRYERWARKRIASGKAGQLHLYDVPGTEWPIFGSVYYLWATEALQKAWDADNSLAAEAPRVYARATIEAAVDLVIDPVHHTWVKTHWGDDYMHQENVFFRSLIIAALTSHETLIGDGKHTELLRDQVDTLAAELDASPHGVLEDYPNECYPIDVFSAIACIQRADKVLGTDHSEFIKRSIRAFEGDMLDKRGLIPYLMDDDTGELLGPSRGVGNSYTLIFGPELWPDHAKEWYRLYEERFWQKKWWAAGFREYPAVIEPEFSSYMAHRMYYDVDAGPIIAGFSPAANAFGLAAAKINGRLDHAYTLGTQVIAATWPLPNGRLLGPRILSDPRHAPYLGETCMLFFFAQRPHASAEIVTGGYKPASVYFGLLFYFATGLLFLLGALRSMKKWRSDCERIMVPYQTFQFVVWLALLATAVVLALIGRVGVGMTILLIAQFLPRFRRDKQVTQTDINQG